MCLGNCFRSTFIVTGSIYRNILFFYNYRTFTKAQMQSKLLLADFLQTTVLARFACAAQYSMSKQHYYNKNLRALGPFNTCILLNGWISLHCLLD